MLRARTARRDAVGDRTTMSAVNRFGSFMRRYAQRSVRPLLIASCALLVLSVAAPWMWRAVGIVPTPADDARVQERPSTSTPISVLVRETPASRIEDPQGGVAIPAEPVIDWEPAPRQVATRPTPVLERFEIPPQVAVVEPPFAELIELDPSLPESPNLPPRSQISPRAPELRRPSEEALPGDLEAPLPPIIDRMPPIIPRTSHGVWPYAESLMRQLDQLAEEFPAAQSWTSRVGGELERLSQVESLSSDDAGVILDNLHGLADEARQYASPQFPTRERSLRLRVGYALKRRLALWDKVHEITSGAPVPKPATTVPAVRLGKHLAEIDQLLQGSLAEQHWRRYLRLDDLHQLAALNDAGADERALARDVLRRLDSSRLDHRQYDFLASGPFLELAKTLLPLAQESIDWAGLLDAIEQHEAHDGTRHSRRVAEIYSVMQWSTDLRVQELASSLNANYRNANVRVAISEQLLNRFVPAPQIMAEPVVDNIRGAHVFGRSESLTRLRVVLLPNRDQWHLGLAATGAVASETESSKGPARFWNEGLGGFQARKEIVVDRRGLAVAGAQAHASAESYLKELETNYDPIPLVGTLARSIARSQYEHEQPAARWEIEGKISARASSRLDQEVDRRLAQAEIEFQQKLLAPLDRLNLEPTPVDMETTARRLVVRYRLAGPHQLSASTPRPQAPGNSLLSLQLHDSVMNNALENLKLEGRRVDLRTLYVEILRQFDAPQINIPEDLPEDVTVQFADHDAVRVSCDHGRVKLTIRLKELDHAGRNVWRNFEVRGYYRPSDNQLEANLVREGNLELSGERLKLGDQVALRGIFANVLSRNRQLSIVNRQLLTRPQLTDLQVTQFVIQDGWIGIALGPQTDNVRPAPMPPTFETPELTRRPIRSALQNLR
jgi:hypothetical protein